MNRAPLYPLVSADITQTRQERRRVHGATGFSRVFGGAATKRLIRNKHCRGYSALLYKKMEYLVILFVIAIVFVAEYFHIQDIIFPEIAALAFGACRQRLRSARKPGRPSCLAPRPRSWTVRKCPPCSCPSSWWKSPTMRLRKSLRTSGTGGWKKARTASAWARP